MDGYGGDGSGGAGSLWGRTFLSTAVTEKGEDRPLAPGTRLLLTFQDGNLRAHAGCNHVTGPVSLDGGRVGVGALASTMMSCGDVLDGQDRWLAGFLSANPTWRLDGDDLVLSTGDTEIR